MSVDGTMVDPPDPMTYALEEVRGEEGTCDDFIGQGNHKQVNLCGAPLAIVLLSVELRGPRLDRLSWLFGCRVMEAIRILPLMMRMKSCTRIIRCTIMLSITARPTAHRRSSTAGGGCVQGNG